MGHTNIGYEGIVKLRFNIGSKEIVYQNHNEGLPSLFKTICKALSGFNIDEDRPHFMNLKYGESATTTQWYSAVVTPMSLSSVTYGPDPNHNGDFTVKFTSILTFNNLMYEVTDTDLSGTGNKFRLCLQDSNGIDLAYLPLEPSALGYLSSGTQAIIEWTMTFKNVLKEG